MDGTLHIGRSYDILRSNDDGRSWQLVTSLPRSPVRRVAGVSRLACRLLRQEVRALVRLSDGTYVASNREGVFSGREGDREMKRCAIEERGSRLSPPMRLTVGPDDVVIWGEYWSRRPTRLIRLYASRDRGRSFEIIRTFDMGEVFHIHNIKYDPREDHYWVLAGDHDGEPGIARLSTDFEKFEWFVKGEQRFRAVEIFDLGDRLVYAMDTEKEANGLISLDKTTGRTERLREFDGSCIYACQFGGLYALTTSVEPSEVNDSRWATLWLSRDCEHWKCAQRAEKDRWHPDYFQFGSLVLPSGATGEEQIVLSGQAVKGLDGKTFVARLAEGEEL